MGMQDLNPNALFSQRRITRSPVNNLSYQTIHQRARDITAVVSIDGAGGTFKSIIEAIAYVKRIGSGNIYITPGTYIVEETITLYNNISLIGADPDLTIIDFNGDSSAHVHVTGSTYNIEVKGLTLQNANTSYLLTTGSDPKRIVFENLIFGTTGGDNYIDLSGGTFLTIKDCEVTDGNANFLYTTSTYVAAQILVDNCRITTTEAAFRGDNSGFSRLSVINSRILADGGCIYGAFGACKFIGNRFLSDGNQINPLIYLTGVSASDKNIISGNNFDVQSDDSVEAIKLDGDGGRNIVNGNYIVGGSDIDAIKLISSDNNVITGNVINVQGSSGYGVNISNAACDSNVVVGNFIGGQTGDVNNLGTGSVVANNG